MQAKTIAQAQAAELQKRHIRQFVTPESIEWARSLIRDLELSQTQAGCNWHAEGRPDKAAVHSGRALVLERLIDHLDDMLAVEEGAAAASAPAPEPAPSAPVGGPPRTLGQLIAAGLDRSVRRP